MKRVNLEPQLDQRKSEIMKQFHTNNDPVDPVSTTMGSESGSSANPPSEEILRERVIEALKTIYDPEIPVNIYDLGLIYNVEISGNFVDIDMTLTAPGCPVAHTFPGMVERSVSLVPGIEGAAVELVWEPPWTQNLISEAARLELGLI